MVLNPQRLLQFLMLKSQGFPSLLFQPNCWRNPKRKNDTILAVFLMSNHHDLQTGFHFLLVKSEVPHEKHPIFDGPKNIPFFHPTVPIFVKSPSFDGQRLHVFSAKKVPSPNGTCQVVLYHSITQGFQQHGILLPQDSFLGGEFGGVNGKKDRSFLWNS